MKIKVNGVDHQVEPGTRTLLNVLRDDLGLSGPKEGCGIGVCGACTVLLDGKPVSSCDMLAALAAQRKILTIEGLAKDNRLHAIQQAFIDHAAFQCAYCTPGFILSTLALLNENPSPRDEEVRDYLSGNLCRCGSYKNILKAVRALRK